MDIKFLWEPARFGWVFALARAYLVTGDERYPSVFWEQLARFLTANPAYLGWNWASAQEAALRLLALSFAWQVFAGSPHSHAERARLLGRALAFHAARIPPTLVYARAQNNNHLLSEAAGLYTAGVTLPEHPSARRWQEIGWRWFQRGLRDQIAEDGTYIQHSVNYHRLMLQLALWMALLARTQGRTLPHEITARLAAATRWLEQLVDRRNGRAPNLGPNDGAYILPLTVCPFEDHRPVLQSAAQAFLGRRYSEAGVWDEMALWLLSDDESLSVHHDPMLEGLSPQAQAGTFGSSQTPHILRSPNGESWAYLRAARFRSRPGHADQLHIDLWWRGENLGMDAGTYLYNGAPPWDNGLAGSQVHNTVTLDGQDQMQRAGRFLFLGWAQASSDGLEGMDDGSLRISAWHDGYRRLGTLHRRTLTALADGGWRIQDALLPAGPARSGSRHFACLHWLLPDWEWQAQKPQEQASFALSLRSPIGNVRLHVTGIIQGEQSAAQIQLVRAGELIYGDGSAQPTWGWYSPTYGVKKPALSLHMTCVGRLPIYFESLWEFE